MLGAGSNTNLIGFGTGDNTWTVRNDTGTYYAINLFGIVDSKSWNKFRVTQTDATTWTITINDIDAGTLTRSSFLNIDRIANGYLTEFVRCSVAFVDINTAVTGRFILNDIYNEVTDKNIVNTDLANNDVAVTNSILVHGDAASRVDILVPQKDSTRFLKYKFSNIPNATIASDVWKIEKISSVEPLHYPLVFSNERDLTVAHSEWECAVRITDDDDFFGGTSHGKDEKTAVNISIDGTITAPENISFESASEVVISQTSENYKKVAADYRAINVATSVRDWTFNTIKFNYKTSVSWKTVESISASYLSMIPLIRSDGSGNVTDFGLWGDSNPPIRDISSTGFGQINGTGTDVRVWGDDNGLSVKTVVNSNWANVNRKNFVSDSATYNKIYNDFYGVHTTSVSEIFNADTDYFISLTDKIA